MANTRAYTIQLKVVSNGYFAEVEEQDGTGSKQVTSFVAKTLSEVVNLLEPKVARPSGASYRLPFPTTITDTGDTVDE